VNLRRTAALVLAAALPLAACGGGTSDEPESSGGQGGQSSGEADFPRTVEHDQGSTEIPAQPERVVVLDTGELDSVLALGVTPVGAVTTDVATGFLSYLQDAAADVEQVGTIGEPNLEAIAAAQPDLILSNSVRHADLYDELSQIAPTVFAADLGDTWKENFLLDAEALGMEEEAEEVLNRYEADAAALGESLGEDAGAVSPVRFVAGAIRVYSAQSFIGTVLTDIGLPLVDVPEGEVPTFAELSPEQVTQADADIVLYSSFGTSEESGAEEVLGGPLWSRLTAVQEGRAYEVEDDVFYTGIGPMAATLMVERLSDTLT
jgi:iron complex transport system substrate-binding protein